MTFKGKEGNCPWNGNGSDPDQFGLKNRTDASTTYHDVSWSAVGNTSNLPFPKAPMHRKDWTDAQLAQIKPYEGVPIRVVGYVVAIKPQNGGSGEGTNCKFNQVGDVDTHIALVEKAGNAEHDSVVIEFTPRFLKAHPNWTKAKLSPWLDSDNPVRSVLDSQKRPRPRRLGWAFLLRRAFGKDPLIDRRGQPMRWVGRLKPRVKNN